MSDLAGHIKLERSLIFDSIPCCSYSVFPCNLICLSKYVLCCSLKTMHHYCMISLFIDHYRKYTNNNNHDDDDDDIEQEKEEHEEEDEQQQQQQQQQEIVLSNCEKHDTKDELTYDDINMVVSSLGIEGWRNIHKQDKGLIQEAHMLLDSKNASLEELKEAFYVFDRNEDGFITAFELWSVLRRLGLKEGKKYEDCEEMIRVYDKDGDGRICFNEFKNMMEQAL